MKASTREWVEKAEADYATALREFRARRQPNYDDACFHAQQCLEKYLKARLMEADIRFPRTHDLEELLDLNVPQEPLWEVFRPKLIDLTSFAVAFRYPGETATRDMAKLAVADCKLIRKAIRNRLGMAEL
jgi:HEPN domain-containing protein